MEGLNFENILGEDEIKGLFSEDETASVEASTEEKGAKEEEGAPSIDNNETEKTTEAVNPEDLFEGDTEKQPESVGSEDKEGKEGDSSTETSGDTSPENFYSSIANAAAVDGVFPNLEEEDFKQVVDAESFSALFDKEVEARLDDAQRRIKNALDNGVEPDAIRKYEGVISQLSKISEQSISAETDEAEQLRSQLIYQDFLNRGMSSEKAQKLTKRSVDAGTDIEDAKEALQSNKEFFQKQYNQLLEEAQENAEREKANRKKEAEKLKTSILKDKQLLGDMELNSEVRKKVYDNIMKPIYKDPETGEYLTAIQKYEQEHRSDFLKYVGLFYSLTNGFKDFDSFVKGKVQKETKKGLRELEKVLTNSKLTPSGTLKMVTSVKDDPESFIGGDFKLAL